jgi:hypothetical protein
VVGLALDKIGFKHPFYHDALYGKEVADDTFPKKSKVVLAGDFMELIEEHEAFFLSSWADTVSATGQGRSCLYSTL